MARHLSYRAFAVSGSMSAVSVDVLSVSIGVDAYLHTRRGEGHSELRHPNGAVRVFHEILGLPRGRPGVGFQNPRCPLSGAMSSRRGTAVEPEGAPFKLSETALVGGQLDPALGRNGSEAH
jgi:hypothetical protein